MKSQKNKENKKADFRDLPLGKKKQSFFRWLLKRGVSVNRARLITYKKFFHGDPFEKE